MSQNSNVSVSPTGVHVVVDSAFNQVHSGNHLECAAIAKGAALGGVKVKVMTEQAYKAEYAKLTQRNQPPPELVAKPATTRKSRKQAAKTPAKVAPVDEPTPEQLTAIFRDERNQGTVAAKIKIEQDDPDLQALLASGKYEWSDVVTTACATGYLWPKQVAWLRSEAGKVRAKSAAPKLTGKWQVLADKTRKILFTGDRDGAVAYAQKNGGVIVAERS